MIRAFRCRLAAAAITVTVCCALRRWGYELPRTKAVELELDGEWVESKYGYQLQVEQWQEIVPQTADGLLA